MKISNTTALGRCDDARSSSLCTRYSVLRTSPAFTLVELLVVLGIIVAVVSLGIPLFGVLTGSRSQEAGQNLVSAALGQARSIALNEGRSAGVLFYVDPATERTAMSIVVIQDPATGLEDADPYDKYKTFTGGQTYRSPIALADGTPVRGDRVITLASDAEGTFRDGSRKTSDNVYQTTNPLFSRLSLYFGNYKPTVRVYRGQMDPTNAATGAFATLNDTPAVRPPRNGPFYTANPTGATGPTPVQVRVPTQASGSAGVTTESTRGPFENANWGPTDFTPIEPYATASDQQLLPIGVGVQVVAQPTSRSDTPFGTPGGFGERYFRTGLIMFDAQGRLSLQPRGLSRRGTLGQYLGLTADTGRTSLVSGIGLVVYDATAFRASPDRTEADWYTQPGSPTAPIQSTNPAFNDGQTLAKEQAEEQWLDGNTIPLLINRFSGALSEGQ